LEGIMSDDRPSADSVESASELFNRTLRLSILRRMPPGDLFAATATLKALGQFKLIGDLYKTWIAFNSDNELIYVVYFNYGTALNEAGDRPGAINAFREGIRIKPDFYPPYINLGRALEDAGLSGEAIAQWLALVNDTPMISGTAVMHKVVALNQIGRVLESNFNDDAAEDALKQSLEINIEQDEIIQHWLALRQRGCKWPVIAPWEGVKRERLIAAISPLSLANLTDDPIFLLARAYRYNRQSIGVSPLPGPVISAKEVARRRHERLRIGYLSSDLREHAVGFGMTDVVEIHDRIQFEIYAYYCGIARVDATQTRTKAAVDHWIDINGLSDEQAAQKIAEDEIDILIDLNGYTKSARTRIVSMRPAPIIVNWFGYPGSMGSPYHHYIVADPQIIPPEHEHYYSEKVVRLPCYQPNDRRRIVSDRAPTRQKAGLPDDAFVYCCLNGMQKLTEITFKRWVAILNGVSGSVLWLLAGTKSTNERVQRLAAEHGIDPTRIVFAEKMANPDHLARYPLADLFLDNFPYGAHTTAADSLWMGVPVLTMPGRSFATRVCASVVQAAGLDELVCKSPEDYIARAVELGSNRTKMAAIKKKLIEGRDSCLLFDTPKLVVHLEDLYRQMWAEYAAGALPSPDLSNLDIYHDVALTFDIEKTELLSDAAYLALYREKLEHWHNTYPITPDKRLWS
jgi:predicted O-linked N-acetylglucosamine transferase (SPINDLY family)